MVFLDSNIVVWMLFGYLEYWRIVLPNNDGKRQLRTLEEGWAESSKEIVARVLPSKKTDWMNRRVCRDARFCRTSPGSPVRGGEGGLQRKNWELLL